ncbi:MAG: enolase C-terminal domain-like protein [Polyangia bacterium]
MAPGCSDTAIRDLTVAVYRVPTEAPESDGTLAWDHTTLVVVHVRAGDQRGLGYTYGAGAAAALIRELLAGLLQGRDALAIPECWVAMARALRNVGLPGIAATAVSAVDIALWDLKARLLGVSLVDLLGAARERIPIYGSGGFTSYSERELQEQLGGWAAQGIRRVKMKVGRQPDEDPRRVRAARQAIGPDTELFIDANGAYTRKEALRIADSVAASDVRWFEEPVSSDDLLGLRLVRDRAPAGMAIAAGEYGYDPPYFQRLLDAGAVDVLQADATRCRGISGFLHTGGLCEAAQTPLSAHCAPSVHAHPACALPRCCHLEYFHDHARIEHLLFDGALTPRGGALTPDRSRPGLGLELKQAEAERFRVQGGGP